MKKIFLLALPLLILASCGSKEEKMLMDCISPSLKCPSTLKIISYEKKEIEAHVDYDTIFHISKIYGKKYRYFSGYERVDSAKVDKYKVGYTEWPAYTYYTVIYDAQNSFGATVREEVHVTYHMNKCVLWDEFFNYYYHSEQFMDEVSCDRILVADQFSSWEDGDWVSKFGVTHNFN